MDKSNKTATTCLYIGLGCGAIILIGVLIAVGLGFWGMQKVKEFEADMKDPEARAEKARTILGAESLPPGYYGSFGISIPFLMDMAFLTLEPPNEANPENPGDPAFIYFNFLTFSKQQQELRDFFDGKTSDASVLQENNIDFDADEVVARGTLEVADQTVLWAASRGDVRTSGTQRENVLVTLLLIECPGQENKMRMGIWLNEPKASVEVVEAAPVEAEALSTADLETGDLETGEPAEPEDFTGTMADPERIRELMGYFQVCG